MSGVKTITLGPEDAGQRLDKWFKAHYPGLSFGRLQKILRKGEVRLDGKKVKDAKTPLEAGQTLRLPPLDAERSPAKPKAPRATVTDKDAAEIRAAVLHKDDHVLILNKPAGLAVQGGTGMTKHVDAMLDALKFDLSERPRLVHRLDKDTSGLLVLARTQHAAQVLTKAFRTKAVRKAYWALVVGVPEKPEGRIDLALAKRPGKGGERMEVDEFDGKRAVTEFKTVERAAQKAAWLELEPITGRTHQLRVHMAAIGTPILGDGKYGGQEAFLTGADLPKKLHLHARAIRFPHPGGGTFETTAPLPEHMRVTWSYFGFSEHDAPPPFEDPDSA